MTAFLSAAVFLQRYSLYAPENPLPLWPERSFFFTVFVLSTLAAQIFTGIIVKLSSQAKVMKKQVQHIKALYEAIEMFSHHQDPSKVASLFASYSRTLTGANKVIVWLEACKGQGSHQKDNQYMVRGPRHVLSEETWYPYIKSMFENRQGGPKIDVHVLPSGENGTQGRLVTVKVKSNSQVFGILSAYYLDSSNNLQETKQTLSFLADLCANVLEKQFLESLAEQFLLMEEKDRIAGEIHDSVSQNIFGLIHGLGVLIKNESLSEHVKEHLVLMQRIAQASLKDLRASIYNMSSVKSEKETLIETFTQYLSDLEKLNGVKTNLQSSGDLVLLNASTKRALHRILREATGNAIRHGECRNINVMLTSDDEQISLVIEDDGVGFDASTVPAVSRGLGLISMRELARNLGGDLVVTSEKGKGTVVSCIIPAAETVLSKGKAIV